MTHYTALILAAVLILGCSHSQKKATDAGREEAMVLPAFDLETLKKKIDRFAPVAIPYDPSSLEPGDQKAVKLLVEASKMMDELFWMQASSQGLDLRARLGQPKTEAEKQLAHYLAINYGPYDRLDNLEPFIQTSKRPPGATFYPEDMSKQEFNQWLKEHPEDKQAFQGWFTVIRRRGAGLVAVPYSQHYQNHLQKAAGLLTRAASQVSNQSLRKFLLSRAEAFASNQYRASDMDWMDVQDSALEVTIGPYEVYEDHLFNYKAAFESFITLRDKQESEKLSRVGKFVRDMESNLPIPDQHKNFERGWASPIVVANLIYAAGDTRAGVQTLAFNLPNDEMVREKKGSKKVMLKNISQAKFDKILTPIAARVVVPEQRDQVTFDAYFNHTLMHEISHGLGPGRIEHQGKKVPVSILLKELYSTIEEAKADTLGMYNTLYLVGRGELGQNLKTQGLITFMAGIFRSVRFGAHEAHGRANLIVFNYLLEKKAYRYHSSSSRFSVDLSKVEAAVGDLSRELLMLEAEGDYSKTKAFIEKYAEMGQPMKTVLGSLVDVPVDIEPIFEVEKN